MILKRPIFFFALATLVFVSCKEGKTTKMESSTQMKEVMAIHDHEVMPKMGTLGKLVAELKGKVDSSETGLKYKAAMKDLQAAHQSMMDWMQDFGNKFDSDEILNGKMLTEQKQKWLDEEERKIKELREEINSSIKNAEKLLAEGK